MGISAESLFYFSIREFCEKNVSKLLDKVKPSLVISSLCNFFTSRSAMIICLHGIHTSQLKNCTNLPHSNVDPERLFSII